MWIHPSERRASLGMHRGGWTLMAVACLAASCGSLAAENSTGSGGQPPFGAARGQQRVLQIDEGQATVAGIRKLNGRHLTLYTDVPASPEVDELPAVFDLAVPQWSQYFGIDPDRTREWHMTAFIMRDKTRFQSVGMLPPNLPPFLHGWQEGSYLWLYDQPDAYYRRHLLLHEGTHAVMKLFFGGTGPPWYGEGLAELLATHRWQDGQLSLCYVPKNVRESLGWGRVLLIKKPVAERRALTVEQVTAYGPDAHLEKEPYAWSWALVLLLEKHPRYQARFRGLLAHVRDLDLNSRFRQQLQDDWLLLREEWQLMIMNIDYGYDVARAAVVRKPAQPLPADGTTVTIAADRGWQATGVFLEGGATYQLKASGRYQVAQTTEPWWCEAGGVTISYYHGRPLGMLVGAIRDDNKPLTGLSPLCRPESIGLEREWTVKEGGALYLKINESPGHLDDNEGKLQVQIRRREP